ncbi:acyltransferase domain-containing protein [Amycolatopsis minnesotensis]|uniref:Carrier domain-containing protein n=1 Tax=Amycolatopsis minnesotensis TaxID=337894 RepID=A0ABN2R6K9_9PSEU
MNVPACFPDEGTVVLAGLAHSSGGAEFDAEFFGVPGDRDATARALELTWSALEDAGAAPERLGDCAIGVCLGDESETVAGFLRRRWARLSVTCPENPSVSEMLGDAELVLAPVDGDGVGVYMTPAHASAHGYLIRYLVPSPLAPRRPRAAPFPVPLALSATSEGGLRGLAARLLDELGELDPVDLAYSLAATRTSSACRAVVLGADLGELRAGLTAVASGGTAPNVVRGTATDRGGVAFLFPGEGGQRPGMGRELYETFGVFANALDEMCGQLAPHSPWQVRGLLLGTDDCAGITAGERELLTQDALFVLQIALARLLESWRVVPDRVLGHSVGEMAAATVAGVFTHGGIAAVLAERVRLVRELMPSGGTMIALQAGEAETLEALAGHGDAVSLAAVNSPASVVVSGEYDAVHAIGAKFQEQGRKYKELNVRRAFHSAHMDPLLPGFRRVVASVERSAPSIPVVSILHGRLGTTGELHDPGYWAAQVRHTSRFSDGVAALESAGVDTIVDLGANGVLAALAQDCLGEHADAVVVPALRGGAKSDAAALLSAVAKLYVAGVPVDWAAVFTGYDFRRVRLPVTPPGVPAVAPAAPPDRRSLAELVLAQVAAVLEVPEAGVRAKRSFLELGFDSLAAVELVKRLNERTGLRLPTPVVFDHPTPRALAAHLADRLGAEPGPPRAEAVEPARADDVRELAALSDEEIFRLVDAEVDAAGQGGRG